MPRHLCGAKTDAEAHVECPCLRMDKGFSLTHDLMHRCVVCTHGIIKALDEESRGLDVWSGVARKEAPPTQTRRGTVRVYARHLHVVHTAKEV